MSDVQNLEAQVIAELSKVMEPDLGKDLVSLNMIEDLVIEGSTASFTVVLTTPACPYKDQISREARETALRVDGITEANVTLGANVSTSRQEGEPIKNIIAVSSGKGGVGKSTIAANLAIALHQSGAAVGLMDADILGPNIPMMMGIKGAPASVDGKIQPAEAYGVPVMSMGFLVDPERAMIWRGAMLHSAIKQFFSDVNWTELDYMIVDLPPGTGDVQLSLAQSVPLTGAIIVTQPQEVALSDAVRGLDMFEKLNVPIVGVIENMSGDFFGEGGGEKLAERRGVPFLGSVPLDAHVRVGGDSGSPIIISHPDSTAAQSLVRISQQVASRISVLNFTKGDDSIPLVTIG